MKILVDTSIWSLVLRRKTSVEVDDYVHELTELIKETRASLIGPIRQELLSGIKTPSQFTLVKQHLSAFKDIPITTEDYEYAAELFNKCRSKGIQGSNTDFLICAVAVNNQMPIFSADHDFDHYSKYSPIKRYALRNIKNR